MTNVVVASSAAKTTSQSANDERVGGGNDGKPYVPFVIAGIGLVGIYVAYLLSKRRDSNNRFAVAATKFRDAFAPELAAAEADTRNEVNYMEFLRTAYDERHAQAYIAFEQFVPAENRRSFKNDWNRYRYGENKDGSTQEPDTEDMNHDDLYFLEYSIEWDLRHPERPRENAIKRIRNLLSYASAP
jgi:hypothetical protein